MPLQSSRILLQSQHLGAAVTLSFFVMFARFEYALIAAGYLAIRRNGSAVADWDRFINDLNKLDGNTLAPVLSAGAPLLKSPPKKLTVVGGSPKFVLPRRNGESDIRWLMEGVKRARNNLFHGGKYYTAPNAPGRNRTVITASLQTITALLGLNHQCVAAVERQYNAI